MGSLPILKIVLFVLAFALASMLLGFAKAGLQQRKANKQQRAEQIAKLEKQMREAAKMLEFELAAALRDQIIELRGK